MSTPDFMRVWFPVRLPAVSLAIGVVFVWAGLVLHAAPTLVPLTATASATPSLPASDRLLWAGAADDTLGIDADTIAAVERAIAEINSLRSSLATTFDPEQPVDVTTFQQVCKPVKMRAMAVAEANGWRIQQLSAKNRNPAHALDDEARAAYDRFIKTRTLTDFWTESRNGGTDGARYFRRITVEASCLACHGAKENRPAFVKKGYPEDRAYGFDVGDLRGVYSVFVPAERP